MTQHQALPPETLDACVAAAHHAADVAAAVIRPFFRAGLAAARKGDESPVTVADQAAEQAIRAVLSHRLPEHGILGEEYGLDRPAARFRWVLDPIDGTRAFITGRPLFGTLIALLDDGAPVLGLLDQPISGERWLGVSGRPTLFTGGPGAPGGLARTRSCPALAEAELSCTAPEIFDDAGWLRFRRLQAAVRRTTWGGDCYGYGLLALGGVDVIAEAGLKVWDWAALVPIIEGAGGRVTSWDGSPLRAGASPEEPFDILALGDPALAAPALDLLSA